jgi:hypothetical protein
MCCVRMCVMCDYTRIHKSPEVYFLRHHEEGEHPGPHDLTHHTLLLTESSPGRWTLLDWEGTFVCVPHIGHARAVDIIARATGDDGWRCERGLRKRGSCWMGWV